MNAKLVYLDSSSIVKRYVEETGSEVADAVYEKAETGALKFAFSLWNIGETVGALDRYFSRELITEKTFKAALTDFISESIKMARLNSLQILPITAECLIESWLTILKHHIYEADALQISTSKQAGCDLLLSADDRLIQTAIKEGLTAINLEKDPQKALDKLV